jgi:hypothetical protein
MMMRLLLGWLFQYFIEEQIGFLLFFKGRNTNVLPIRYNGHRLWPTVSQGAEMEIPRKLSQQSLQPVSEAVTRRPRG